MPQSSRDVFDAAYRQTPPWEVGRPQPALLALLEEFPPAGPALDLGCGTGVLSLALAGRGLSVLGVDLAASAIAQAQARAAASPELAARPEFRVADGRRPAQLPGPFGTIVDSGFFHLFGREVRAAFARDLAAALAPGGRYYLLGFAINSPFPNAPRQVLEEELRRLFSSGAGWTMLALRPASFVTLSARGDVPALAACFERLPQDVAR
jgi:SAM-dependent methyltransferase